MRFANAEMLWALLLVPVLVGIIAYRIRRRNVMLQRFAAVRALDRMLVERSGIGVWRRPLLLLLAVIGVVTAMARPQWGYEDRRIVSRGADVLIAIDTSTSMLARDIRPNRLERAKDLLQNLLWEVKGDRVGVMAFAGSAAILCPLTLDYRMADAALEAVSVRSVSTQGTAVGTAINAAVKAFEAGSPGERVLILLTDGEDQGTEPLEAARKAAEAKVKIVAIGIGTTQGTPIPLDVGFKEDQEGKVVNTRLDFQTLTEIARITNGQAVRANMSGLQELEAVKAVLNSVAGQDQQDRIFRVYKERYAWFLLPAILLLILETAGIGSLKSIGRMPRRTTTSGSAEVLRG